MRIRITILFSLLLVIALQSCKKDDVYPIEPFIEMSTSQVYKSPTHMYIDFTDGDGDIGFNEGDTLPPYDYNEDDFNKYYYNLLLYYFVKDGDEWVEIEPAVPFYYRIPYITPRGQNKSLKGEIEIDNPFPSIWPDSVRYEIELIDRALHESNRITTPVFYQ